MPLGILMMDLARYRATSVFNRHSMLRLQLVSLCLIAGVSASANDDHSRHHVRSYHGHWHSPGLAAPGLWSVSPFSPCIVPVVVGGGYYPPLVVDYGAHRALVPVFISTGANWLPNPMNSHLANFVPAVSVRPVSQSAVGNFGIDPAKLPARPSTAAGRLKSLEQQVHGDDRLRKSLWAQARCERQSMLHGMKARR